MNYEGENCLNTRVAIESEWLTKQMRKT